MFHHTRKSSDRSSSSSFIQLLADRADKRITYTRMGAMSQMLQFEASVNLVEDIKDMIRHEVMYGYRDHSQKSFSTYLLIEGAYFGCLRYSREDINGVPVVILKMFNQQGDATRKYTATINAIRGATEDLVFKAGTATMDEACLTAVMKIWFDDQFVIDDSILYTGIPCYTARITGDHYVDTFISHCQVAASKEKAIVVAFGDFFTLEEGLSNSEIDSYALLSGDGGGVIMKRISHGDEERDKPSLWRKTFTWLEAPTKRVDVLRTGRLLSKALDGTIMYSWVNNFPSEMQ